MQGGLTVEYVTAAGKGTPLGLSRQVADQAPCFVQTHAPDVLSAPQCAALDCITKGNHEFDNLKKRASKGLITDISLSLSLSLSLCLGRPVNGRGPRHRVGSLRVHGLVLAR